MEHRVERFIKEGCAFIPRNDDGVGERLILMFKNGETESIQTTVRTYLRHVVRFFGNDLAALRRVYGQVIGKRYQVPLPLTVDMTLVPYKVRRPIGRQGAYGWFMAEEIRGLRRLSRVHTAIYLTGEHEITGLQSLESCEKRLRHVLLVKNHYTMLHGQATVVHEPGFGVCYSVARK